MHPAEGEQSVADTNAILVEIAPGELIDKITILEIKDERIADAAKRANVRVELDTLNTARAAAVAPSADLDRLTADLKAVTGQLQFAERRRDDIADLARKDASSEFRLQDEERQVVGGHAKRHPALHRAMTAERFSADAAANWEQLLREDGQLGEG